MKAFVTGSFAYGNPTVDSDIDLVVLIDKKDAGHLLNMADAPTTKEEAYGTDVDCQMRFGKLNIIGCYEPKVFDAWKRGTEQLVAVRPVTRERAKGVLSVLVNAAQEQARDNIWVKK